jgi:hypothetical protein
MLFLDTATSAGDFPACKPSSIDVRVSVDCCLSLESRLCFYEADHAEHSPYWTENFAESDSKMVEKYMHYAGYHTMRRLWRRDLKDSKRIICPDQDHECHQPPQLTALSATIE